MIARRLAMTPDRLLGRVEAARTTIARTAQPLGPLVAGLLLGARLEPDDGGAARLRLGRPRGLRHGEPRSAHTASARGSRLSGGGGDELCDLGRRRADLDADRFERVLLRRAVPDEPEMIAPAWPIVFPGGAEKPAMYENTGFDMWSATYCAAFSSSSPPISPTSTIVSVSASASNFSRMSMKLEPTTGSPPMPTIVELPSPRWASSLPIW